MMGAMRRFALYGLGLLLASALALTYTTTGRAKANSKVSHTCSATDHAFLDTARTNMAAIGLWGQEYLDGDMGAVDVAGESARAAKIVGATAPTDPSLAQTRTTTRVIRSTTLTRLRTSRTTSSRRQHQRSTSAAATSRI
jgi:hypothetical protein